jgi:hypothetical protein
MNTIIRNNKEYKLIGYWDNDGDGFDSKGEKFIKPEEGKKWNGQEYFIQQLELVQFLLQKNKYYKKYEDNKNCMICDEKYISFGRYTWKRFIWEDGLIHYIEKHNFQPNELFLDLIFFFKLEKKIKLIGNIKKINNLNFIKINQNQLLIMDALLTHGGYTKKYIDLSNRNILRYSEHTGLLDFKMNILEKIIVAGNTTRVDKGDDEIFLPRDLSDLKKYEYIFHTHPPTPKPGGRVNSGILYEFPSMGDILHFLDNFNDGNICGSLVITSEGIYNIRNKNMNREKLIINENKLFKEFNQSFYNIQDKYIKKYTNKFDKNKFYSVISQDEQPIKELNETLNSFNIHIDFYPRIKIKQNWILDKIYLPLY